MFDWTDIAPSAGKLAMPADIEPFSELPAGRAYQVWQQTGSLKNDSWPRRQRLPCKFNISMLCKFSQVPAESKRPTRLLLAKFNANTAHGFVQPAKARA